MKSPIERSDPRHVLSLAVAFFATCILLVAWLPSFGGMTLASLPRGVLVGMEVQAVVIATFLLARKRWLAAGLLLLALPAHVRFWQGVRRYTRGEAYYFVPGYCICGPDANLSEVHRVPMICRGSSHSVVEWMLWYAPQNLAVDVLTSLRGPMRGAYDGPLPSEYDIRSTVHGSTGYDVTLNDLAQGNIHLGDVAYAIRSDFGTRAISVAFGKIPDETCLSRHRVRASLWRDRVLVLAMPWNRTCAAESLSSVGLFSWAAAIDIRSGKVLGYYEMDSPLDNRATGLAGVWNLDSYGNL